MGDVKLNSSGGGSVTLTTPSTASNLTVTLPSASGTLATTSGSLASPTITGTVAGGATYTSPTLTGASITAANSNTVEATSGPTATQLAGQRNKIINGAMMIDQRNAGASVYLADGVYNLDRFQGSVSQASKISIQQSSTAPTGFKNSQVLTVSSAMTFGAGDYCGNAQSIEGYNVADLNFGSSSAASVILSFWVRSSITGTYSVTLHNGDFNRTCSKAYSINSTNTWEYKSVVFSGDTSGTWLTNNGIGIKTYFALGMGSTYGNATDGVWSSTPKLAVTGQTQWATNAGATFYITGVQLEKGATATPFENRLYGTELALCQRYCVKYDSSTAAGTYLRYGIGECPNSTTANQPLQFLVMMRATPSLTTTGTASNYAIFSAGTILSCSSVPSLSIQSNNLTATIDWNVASGLTAGRGAQLISNGNNVSYLTLTAEL